MASSSVKSSSSASNGTTPLPGPVATESGGFATTKGGDVAGAVTFTSADYTAIQSFVDLHKKAKKGGDAPLLITYTGNEDELIAAIVKDSTIDANHNCPKGHWADTYRELSLKEYTAGITIQGAPGSSANFGITIVKGGNVIVRNMKIGALGGASNDADMIRIDDSPNVWIDHNELFAVNNECNGSPDKDLTFESAIDIKGASHNITVSYNYIHDSKKVGLDGSSKTDIEGGREITFHHNHYHNVNGRLPLQRGGWTHMYNNLYTTVTESGINVRTGGMALIEYNWFENAANPVTCRYDVVNCGTWELKGNNATSSADNAKYNITWSDSGGGANADKWTTTALFPTSKINYSYIPATPECVRNYLPNVAGVGKGLATLNCF